MQLDTYIRKLMDEEENQRFVVGSKSLFDSRGHVVQKLLDALQILDEATYNQILEDGVCECHGDRYKIDREGLVVW